MEKFETIAEQIAPSKGVVSESGWVFLINDTNDFMRWYCGADTWDATDRSKASRIFFDRLARLNSLSIPYMKFIVPEKIVVYPEFAPRKLQVLMTSRPRPAQMLVEDHPKTVFYLDDFMKSLKGMGTLYFRADTHPNWLGAWAIYRFVIHKLVGVGLIDGSVTSDISHLLAQAVPYEGDLLPHLSATQREKFSQDYGFSFPVGGVEWSVKLELPPERTTARAVEVPDEYRMWYPSRETLIYERHDRSGPTVVFFRDSTFDRGVVELLAQHCGRAVFIWHLGVVDLDVLEREKPDLIVHCMAERFVERYRETLPFFRAKREFDARRGLTQRSDAD